MRSARRWALPSAMLLGAAVAAVAFALPASPLHYGIEASASAPHQSSAPASGESQAAASQPGDSASSPHEFYFTRAAYGSSFSGRRFASWTTDYPKADRQFLIGLRRLTNIDAYEAEHPIRLDDPELRRYPFLYAVEVGYMGMDAAEIAGLRDYLLAGGFLFVDDFWGTQEWQNFEQQIRQVLPEYGIVDLSPDHPLFSSFYTIDELIQVPNVQLGAMGGRTWEKDGYQPHYRAIFDDRGRLLVLISWNTDLGDAWEWAEQPYYPLRFSTFAYELGVNAIIYGMSH